MLNRTLELFRRTGAAFTKFPILWVPLIVADVLRSVLQWYSRPLTRAVLLASAPKSALGGGIAGLPSPGKIAFIGGTVGFLTTVLALFFYLYALGMVARALRPNGRHLSGPLQWTMPSAIGSALVRASGLALLFLLFSTGLISGVLLPMAARAHMQPAVLQTVLWLCVVPALAGIFYLSVGFLRQFVLRQQDELERGEGARGPYWVMLFTCAMVSNLASIGLALLTGRLPIAPSFVLLLLQVLASVVTAFPYAYAMSGLSISLPQADDEEA